MAAHWVFFNLVLFLLVSISGITGVNGKCGYLSVVDGGCPSNVSACEETCQPCYRGIGTVQAYCSPPFGPSPVWECRCAFLGGAPCPPSGEPKCPGKWPPDASAYSGHTLV